MAVLTGELSKSQGMPSISAASLQAFSSLSAGVAVDSLLVSYGLISASAGAPMQSSLSAIALAVVSQGNYQQYLSSLARFFGINARQNTTHLIIQKSDLNNLTARDVNTAESLVVAIILRVKEYESNNLISKVVIELFKQEFITLNSTVRAIFLVELYISVVYIPNVNPILNRQIDSNQSTLTPDSINN